jgi:iron complex outermembrane receptor protein
VLSPAVITSHRLLWAPRGPVELGVEGRYQSRSYLDNTRTDALALPAFHAMAASAVLRARSHAITVRVENLTNAFTFASGHVSAGEAAYFVLPPRSIHATLRLAFGGAR